MKRPQWSTPPSTRASVSVENLFDNDNNLEVEEQLAPNTTASEFDGGFEDGLSERSSLPMNVDQDDSDDVEVETKVFLKEFLFYNILLSN
jgi:hypothetical protein